MATSIFSNTPAVSDDELFVFTALHNADTSDRKVNLIIGAYRDENGHPWVLPVVRKVYARNILTLDICSMVITCH